MSVIDRANSIISQYYLLCGVRMGTRAHLLESVPTAIEALFPKKEVDLHLRRVDGVYIARESVSGGDDGTDRTRQPIVVIGGP